MKAAIYSRLSTDRQSESSIADPVRVCREHAQHQGWEVSSTYEDQGIRSETLVLDPSVRSLTQLGSTIAFYRISNYGTDAAMLAFKCRDTESLQH